jgi:hypothetical protein
MPACGRHCSRCHRAAPQVTRSAGGCHPDRRGDSPRRQADCANRTRAGAAWPRGSHGADGTCASPRSASWCDRRVRAGCGHGEGRRCRPPSNDHPRGPASNWMNDGSCW